MAAEPPPGTAKTLCGPGNGVPGSESESRVRCCCVRPGSPPRGRAVQAALQRGRAPPPCRLSSTDRRTRRWPPGRDSRVSARLTVALLWTERSALCCPAPRPPSFCPVPFLFTWSPTFLLDCWSFLFSEKFFLNINLLPVIS